MEADRKEYSCGYALLQARIRHADLVCFAREVYRPIETAEIAIFTVTGGSGLRTPGHDQLDQWRARIGNLQNTRDTESRLEDNRWRGFPTMRQVRQKISEILGFGFQIHGDTGDDDSMWGVRWSKFMKMYDIYLHDHCKFMHIVQNSAALRRLAHSLKMPARLWGSIYGILDMLHWHRYLPATRTYMIEFIDKTRAAIAHLIDTVTDFQTIGFKYLFYLGNYRKAVDDADAWIAVSQKSEPNKEDQQPVLPESQDQEDKLLFLVFSPPSRLPSSPPSSRPSSSSPPELPHTPSTASQGASSTSSPSTTADVTDICQDWPHIGTDGIPKAIHISYDDDSTSIAVPRGYWGDEDWMERELRSIFPNALAFLEHASLGLKDEGNTLV
jgi:hypothetical protein